MTVTFIQRAFRYGYRILEHSENEKNRKYEGERKEKRDSCGVGAYGH